jgi:hypothetical protein
MMTVSHAIESLIALSTEEVFDGDKATALVQDVESSMRPLFGYGNLGQLHNQLRGAVAIAVHGGELAPVKATASAMAGVLQEVRQLANKDIPPD